jgi:hypothetical protein
MTNPHNFYMASTMNREFVGISYSKVCSVILEAYHVCIKHNENVLSPAFSRKEAALARRNTPFSLKPILLAGVWWIRNISLLTGCNMPSGQRKVERGNLP